MLKKKTVALALTGMLALAPLTACGANASAPSAEVEEPTAEEETPTTDETTNEGDGTVDGTNGEDTTETPDGWVVNTDFSATLSSDEQDIFERAAADYDGEELTPVTVLATQVVSGANYAYLCEEATDDEDAETGWAIAVVYNDLQGEASVSSVTDIDLDNIQVGESSATADDLAGGWTVTEQQGTATIPSEAETALEAAMEDNDGVEMEPVILLGTMDEDTPSYIFLCKGAAVADNPEQTLYVVEVAEDAAGNAELAEVSMLDLLAYV